MTNEKLEELERLLKAATPGPWRNDGYGTIVQEGVEVGSIRRGYPPEPSALAHLSDGEYIQNPNAEEDAALIVAAINALPELVAEIKRLQVYERAWHKGAGGPP
jgi:hypothetical protein